MRICPKCGYVDPPIWRHDRFKRNLDISHYEDFKEWYPNIRFKDGWGEDQHYVYRRTSLYVLRKAKVNGFRPFYDSYEKGDRGSPYSSSPLGKKRDPFQIKLSEYLGST